LHSTLILFLTLGTLALTPISHAESLRAGVARTDITPTGSVLQWGYESRKTPATGTLDPLYARVLVLEAGKTRLALVTVDLGRSFGPASLQQLRDSARASSGISCLLVAASHTHSAPEVRDDYPQGPPAWEQEALVRIEKAIGEATKGMQDARIGTGTGSVYVAHNRLRTEPDGSVTWFERNLTHVPTSPVDPTVSVIRIDRADGTPIAVLTNYACHPVVFGPDNLRYSADFPAVMNSTVEHEIAGGVLSFFLQGAPGDLNPYYAVTPLEQDAIKWRDWTGETLGREAARVAKQIHTDADPHPRIDFREDTMNVRLRWNEEKFRAALVKFMGPKALDEYGNQIKPEFPISVTGVLINRQIAFMTVPGEPFVDFQTNWRDRCPVRSSFLLGYTNGYYGYFPTIRAASLGGYGAASASTWVEPGTGERIVDRAVIMMYQMLGSLTDIPDELRRKVF
jgi:neutral ceramidase